MTDETDNQNPHLDSQRSQIAARRYREETRSITVDGIRIATDRESRTGLRLAALAGQARRWKTLDGFRDLTAEQLANYADAADAHAQACFEREAELLEALVSGEYTDVMLGQGWPG